MATSYMGTTWVFPETLDYEAMCEYIDTHGVVYIDGNYLPFDISFTTAGSCYGDTYFARMEFHNNGEEANAIYYYTDIAGDGLYIGDYQGETAFSQYEDSNIITLNEEPSADLLRFLKTFATMRTTWTFRDDIDYDEYIEYVLNNGEERDYGGAYLHFDINFTVPEGCVFDDYDEGQTSPIYKFQSMEFYANDGDEGDCIYYFPSDDSISASLFYIGEGGVFEQGSTIVLDEEPSQELLAFLNAFATRVGQEEGDDDEPEGDDTDPDTPSSEIVATKKPFTMASSTVWKEPIFDRTMEDVEFAIQKLKEWKQSHTHSTDIRVDDDALIVKDIDTAYVTDDKLVSQHDGIAYVDNDVIYIRVGDVYELKGCFNLLDLNRIEGNIAYLAEKLENLSYSTNIHCKQWDRVDMPNQNDMSRIIENIRSLISAFYSLDNSPSLPTTMMSYKDINAIEENLYLLKQLLDNMQGSFKKLGTIRSGSKTFLPIRR